MSYKAHRFILSFAALLLYCTLCMDTAHGHSGTPPVDRTGAPPGYLTCFECHKGTGTTGGVSLSFSGSTKYTAGQMYSLMVTVADPAKLRFGFSMVARDADNNTVNVGTWAAGGADTQVYGPGNTHVGHKNAPFVSSTKTFTVNWTAPAASVGDVTFYVAGNAANGNNSGTNDTGDNIYTNTLTIASNPGPVDHFVISPISSPQTVGTPITGITITAQDASNATATGFTGTVTFGGTGGFSGTSATFTAGVRSGVSVTPTVSGSNLTFTVNDGASHTGSTVIATIQTQYEAWSGGAAFNADANGDGVTNGMAWVLGAANPSANATALLPTLDNTSEPTYFIYTYRRSDAANGSPGTSIAAQYGSSLGGWTTAAHDGTNIIITATDNFYGASPGVDKVEVKIKRTLAVGGKLFARLNAVTPQ